MQPFFFQYSATAQLAIDPFNDSVIEGNQEACRLLRVDIEELRAKRVSAIFSDCLPVLTVFTQELIEKGKAKSQSLIVRAGYNTFHVEAFARFTKAGGNNYICFSLRNLEEIEQERQIWESERHYRSGIGHWNQVSRVFQEFERENQLILDAAGEGIYGVDANGITTFVNPAAQRILGYSTEELSRRNMHSMVHHSHADGSHFSAHDCPIFEAFRDGHVQTVEDDIFWSKNGDPIDVEYTSTPIKENDHIVGAVVIFRDVSQRKEDKKKLIKALNEVEKLKNRLELENAYLQEEINSEFNHHHIIGKSAPVKNMIKQIELVAPTDTTVLVSGESGTGKELVARAIHEMSQRSARSLIRVNCAAIPKELFESEFFGHVKGAFTGAVGDRPGRFELADGGTIFLDEIGEIPLELQSKLLRVIQERQLERVGDNKTRHIDVRVIAATNRNLYELTKQGEFREDLFYRLNVFPIQSVPLRERKEDIALLTQHFLKKAQQITNKGGIRIPLTEISKLERYDWPGNIRELENVLERQVILARNETIKIEHLIPEDNQGSASVPSLTTHDEILTEAELKRYERRNIERALSSSNGKVSGKNGAAEILQMRPTTLASKIKKYKLGSKKYSATGVDMDQVNDR